METKKEKNKFAQSLKDQSLALQAAIIVGALTLVASILTVLPARVLPPNLVFPTPTFTIPLKTNIPQTPIYSTDDTSTYFGGYYAINNNMWNLADAGAESYSQHIDVYEANLNDVEAQWLWSWPEGSGVVKAYPSIIFGQSPIPGLRSTTSLLPVKLSNLGGFVASYDISVSTSQNSSYNTAFDVWITSDNPPTLAGRTAEVMIWINHQRMRIPSVDGRVTIEGQDYDFTIYQAGHRIAIFQKINQESVGSISIDHFLDYLIENGHLSPKDYLADIEFGNEIAFGSGHTIIWNYSIKPTN